MSASTVGTYWRVIAYGSIVGTVLSICVLSVVYLTFNPEFGGPDVVDAIRWGVGIALTTSAMVVAGTIVVAHRLESPVGKGAFVALSFLSPLVGWMLLGLVNGVVVGWDFFFGFPWIAAVASVSAIVIAAVSSLFMPSTEGGASTEEDVAVLLQSADDRPHG